MRIVLDESVPRPLARKLRASGLDVSTFPNDWKGTKNGRLLERVAQAGFGCLLTCDRNMMYQQNVAKLELLIAVLSVQEMGQLMLAAERIASELRATSPFGGVVEINLGLLS